MYGGCDEETVYEDWNMFDLKEECWYGVELQGRFSKREGLSFTLLGGDVYAFGGQMENQEKVVFYNEVYKI